MKVSSVSMLVTATRFAAFMLRCLLAVWLVAGCECKPALTPLSGQAWPQADQLFHRDPRWLGADGVFSVNLGGDRVLWLFGDTFVATSAANLRRESRLVRNTVALQRGRDPSQADIDFYWRPGPSSWFPEDGERWFWPGHGVRLPGGPLILFWSRVRATPGAGLGFAIEGWTAVLIDNPDESPDRWQPRPLAPPLFPVGLLPGMGLFLEDNFIYGLAIRERDDHAGWALRMPATSLARGELTIELWNGAWAPAGASPSAPAIVDAAPEFSLHRDTRLGLYLHVRSLGFGATTLALATAERVTGPWSAPAIVYRPPESDRSGAFVYAGKAHPELTGADLVATYVSNSFDFATLVADSSLYYPRFVRLSYR